jgi:hypothetical protein
MSSSPEAAYLSLKRSRSNLIGLENELHGVAYGKLAPRRSTFTDLESCMRTLCSDPEIAALAETSDVLKISKEAMSYSGFSSGRKLKKAAAYVLERFDSIKERTKYVTERSKPHAAGNRDAVLGLVRRSAAITASGFQLETGSSNPLINIMNKYSKLSSNTAGILRELKIVDPISSYEDEYLGLTEVLQEKPGDAFSMTVKTEKASRIMTLLSSLMAAKKVEYGISDDEAGYIPELEEAREEAEKYKSVSRMLLEQLDAKELKPALVSFDLESFEDSLFKLTKHATRATGKVDGKKMVTTSEGEMKLIFNELNTKLEGTQFSILGARTQDLLDNMHDIVKDPDFLERAIGDYTTLAELVIDNYRLRTKRKSEMAALL